MFCALFPENASQVYSYISHGVSDDLPDCFSSSLARSLELKSVAQPLVVLVLFLVVLVLLLVVLVVLLLVVLVVFLHLL